MKARLTDEELAYCMQNDPYFLVGPGHTIETMGEHTGQQLSETEQWKTVTVNLDYSGE